MNADASEEEGELPRADLADFVSDVSPRERMEVADELWEAEIIRWATRPQPRLWCADTWVRFVVAALMVGFVLFWSCMVMQHPERANILRVGSLLSSVIIITAPFWLLALFIASHPWRQRLRARRTLYIITDRRAVVITPRLGSWKKRSWRLARNMVVRGEARPDKWGNLIFTEIIGGYSVEHRRQVWRYGFLDLPDVWQAEKELRKAIEARRKRTSSANKRPKRRQRKR